MENISDDSALVPSDHSSTESDCSSSLTSVPRTETQSTSQHVSEGNDHGGVKYELNQDFLESTSLKSSNESLNSAECLSNSDVKPSLPVKKHRAKQCSILSFQKPSSYMVKCSKCKRIFHSEESMDVHLQLHNCTFPQSGKSSELGHSAEENSDNNQIYRLPWGINHLFKSTVNSSKRNMQSQEKNGSANVISWLEDKKFEIPPLRQEIRIPENSYGNSSPFHNDNRRLDDRINSQQSCHISYNNVTKSVSTNTELKKETLNSNNLQTENTGANKETKNPGAIEVNNSNTKEVTKNSGSNVVKKRCDVNKENKKPAVSRTVKIQEQTIFHSKVSKGSTSANSSIQIYKGFGNRPFHKNLNTKNTDMDVSNENSTKSFGSSVKKSHDFCNSDGDRAKICTRSKSIANNLKNSNITNTKVSKMKLRKYLPVSTSDANRAQCGIKVDSAATNINDSNFSNATISRRKSFAFENSGGDINKRCTKLKYISTKLNDSNISKTKVGPLTRSHSKENSYADGSSFKKVIQTTVNTSKSHVQDAKGVERNIPKSVSRRSLQKSLTVDTFDADRAQGCIKAKSIATNINDSNGSNTTVIKKVPPKSLASENSGGDRNKICTRSKSITTNHKNSNITKDSKTILRKPLAVNISDANRAQGGIKVDSSATNINDSNFSNTTIYRRKSLAVENSSGDTNKLCTKIKSIGTKLDDCNFSKTNVGTVTRSHVKENSFANESSFEKVVQETVNGSKSYARDAKDVEKNIPKSVSRRSLRKTLAVDTSDADRAQDCINVKSIATNLDDSNGCNTTVIKRVPPESLAFENSGGDRNKICTRSKSITTNLKYSNIANTKYSKTILLKPLAVNISDANRAQGGVKVDSAATNINDSNFSNATISRRKSLAFENSGGDRNKHCTKLKSIGTKLYDSNISKTEVGTVTRSHVKENSFADESSLKKMVQKTVNGSKSYARDSKSVERKIPKSVSRQSLQKPFAVDTFNADRTQRCMKAKSIATNIDDSNGSNTTVIRRVPPKSLAFKNSGGDRNKIYAKSKSVATNLDDSGISNKKDVKGTITRSRVKEISYADGSSLKKVVQETVNDSKCDSQDAKDVERKIRKSLIHNVGDTHIKFLKKSAKSTTIDNFDDNVKNLKRGVRKSDASCNPVTESFKGSTSKSSESSSRIKIRPSTLPPWKK